MLIVQEGLSFSRLEWAFHFSWPYFAIFVFTEAKASATKCTHIQRLLSARLDVLETHAMILRAYVGVVNLWEFLGLPAVRVACTIHPLMACSANFNKLFAYQKIDSSDGSIYQT